MGGSVSKKAESDERLGRRAEAVLGQPGDAPPTPGRPAALAPGGFASPGRGGQPPPAAGVAGPSQVAPVGPAAGGATPGLPGSASAPGLQGSSSSSSSSAAGGGGLEPAGGSLIPTVFRWEHGGNAVYITGAFNGWSNRVPMHRSGNDFVYIASLARGKHTYKFIVDDEWRFAPDQPTQSDAAGNINNTIDLTGFHPDDDTAPLPGGGLGGRRDSLPGVPYGLHVPDEDEFSKEPPLLPPQLRSIVLNAGSPDPWDPGQLPPPNHVTLNHLYCTAIKDGLMVQAVTQRYRRKHVTTVLYSLMPVAASTQAAMAAAGAVGAGMPSGGGAPAGGVAPPGGAPPGQGYPMAPQPPQQQPGMGGGVPYGGGPYQQRAHGLPPGMTLAQALAAGFVPGAAEQPPPPPQVQAQAPQAQIFTLTLPVGDLLPAAPQPAAPSQQQQQLPPLPTVAEGDESSTAPASPHLAPAAAAGGSPRLAGISPRLAPSAPASGRTAGSAPSSSSSPRSVDAAATALAALALDTDGRASPRVLAPPSDAALSPRQRGAGLRPGAEPGSGCEAGASSSSSSSSSSYSSSGGGGKAAAADAPAAGLASSMGAPGGLAGLALPSESPSTATLALSGGGYEYGGAGGGGFTPAAAGSALALSASASLSPSPSPASSSPEASVHGGTAGGCVGGPGHGGMGARSLSVREASAGALAEGCRDTPITVVTAVAPPASGFSSGQAPMTWDAATPLGGAAAASGALPGAVLGAGDLFLTPLGGAAHAPVAGGKAPSEGHSAAAVAATGGEGPPA